jgi:hypothetical protein
LATQTMNTGNDTIQASSTEISVKGAKVKVPSVIIDGRTVITSGKWLKVATVRDEDLVEGETLAAPDHFIHALKNSGLKADLFAFSQRPPEVSPKYGYHMEWDNLAVVPITTFSDWWDNRVESSVRRAVRKASKQGLIVKVAPFDDALVRGIVDINNETPIRQGRPFWHYGKEFEIVKAENSTYADRNVFLGAYFQDELVGYIRLTKVGSVWSVIQILGKVKHFDKRPVNALIAKAVEYCEQTGASHLMYCNYVYNDPESSLTEFKRRNGFEQLLVPKYFVPLSAKGKLAISLGIHNGIVRRLPKPLITRLLRLRTRWYERKLKSLSESA